MSAKLFIGAVAASLMIAGSANATVKNLVNDGTFTGAGDPGGYATYYAVKPMGGWTVYHGSVDLVHKYWSTPPGGGYSVDLDGNSPGWLGQQVDFTHAGKYSISFYLSANPDGGQTPKSVEVSIGDQTQDFTITPGVGHNLTWTKEYFQFNEAPGGGPTISDTLLFRSLDKNTPYGIVLADVVVGAPEPATWAMMLVGFGGLGAVLRMNRRRTLATA